MFFSFLVVMVIQLFDGFDLDFLNLSTCLVFSLLSLFLLALSLAGGGLGDEVEEEMELSIISNTAANQGPELLLSIITALMHDTLDSSQV